MPGTQPEWYIGDRCLLDPCVRTGCKVWGSLQHRGLAGGRDRTGGCRARSLLILPFPQLSQRGW